MKLCQCCGQTAEDNAATCPKCGEASWAAVAFTASAPEDSLVIQGPAEVAPEYKITRNKRK